MVLLAACGGGDNATDDPLALSGAPSDECSREIANGHNMEAAGRPAPFLPSVRECGSLAAWTEAAKAFGIDLNGWEASELLVEHRWQSRRQVALDVFAWIDAWYNPRRRHSSIGGLSPIDYETRSTPAAAAA